MLQIRTTFFIGLLLRGSLLEVESFPIATVEVTKGTLGHDTQPTSYAWDSASDTNTCIHPVNEESELTVTFVYAYPLYKILIESTEEKYAPTEVIPIYKGKAGTACRRMTHATDDAFEVYCKGQQADSFTMAGTESFLRVKDLQVTGPFATSFRTHLKSAVLTEGTEDNAAGRAIDGNLDTYSCTHVVNNKASIEVLLCSLRIIQKIIFMVDIKMTGDIFIELYSGGSYVETRAAVRGDSQSVQYYTDYGNSALKADKIKFSYSGTEFLRFRDIQVLVPQSHLSVVGYSTASTGETATISCVWADPDYVLESITWHREDGSIVSNDATHTVSGENISGCDILHTSLVITAPTADEVYTCQCNYSSLTSITALAKLSVAVIDPMGGSSLNGLTAMLSCTLTNTEWTVTDCVWSFNDEGQHVVRAVDHPICTLEVSGSKGPEEYTCNMTVQHNGSTAYITAVTNLAYTSGIPLALWLKTVVKKTFACP